MKNDVLKSLAFFVLRMKNNHFSSVLAFPAEEQFPEFGLALSFLVRFCAFLIYVQLFSKSTYVPAFS